MSACSPTSQFDNWAYQPSNVSSNTPWLFNGVRVQWFPTAKLKIEPWFINNGWQSYGRFNNRPGLGGQILWRPNGNWSIVGNRYGYGEDALGVPTAPGTIPTIASSTSTTAHVGRSTYF
jgi:hypothetical protein